MMARWHDTPCATPDVFADGHKLQCRNCNNQVGQMSLWWPPSVPYSSKSHVEQQDWYDSETGTTAAARDKDIESIIENGNSVHLGESEPSKVLHDAGATQSSHIYGAVLAADELRPLHLHAAIDASSQFTLPWRYTQTMIAPSTRRCLILGGGEDGDSTPRSAIYVGSYWDILLQTSNCWNMLQYLRPQSDTRIVWVDAIWINQNNRIERAQQVAKMGSIYQHCLRVVVYLGPDIAFMFAESPKRRHPDRRGLHEFDRAMNDTLATEGVTTLRKLLTRRYFSRVWVIQELVLARSAVISVGHTQFWASNLTPKSLVSSSAPNSTAFDWNSTAAPWMHFLGQSSVYWDSWSLRRTHPVLQYLSSSNSLVPSYQISTQHVFIGFFAHILLNFGVAEVLMSASGLAERPGEGHLIGEDQIDKTYTTGIQPPTASLSGVTPGLLGDPGRDDSSARCQRLPVESWRKRREMDPKLYDANSWCRGASADPSTGALSIKLRHLVQFNAAPVLTEVPDLYEVVQGMCSLYMMTQKGGPPLNILVPPGRNHLFYLEKEYGEPGYLLLFLQELNCESPSLPKSFKLILCCAYADIFFLALTPTQKEMGGKEVLESRSDGLKDFYKIHRPENSLKQLFPWGHIPRNDILDVLQGCLNDSFRGKTQTFEAYIQCLRKWIPQCHVQYYINYTYLAQIAFVNVILWEWCYADERAGSTWYRCTPADENWEHWEPGRAISIRARICEVISRIEFAPFYSALSFIKWGTADIVGAGTGEDEATMLKREPQFSDHFVPIRRWPSSLVDSFAVDGVPWQVRIV
ncbi:heterokaryon incompatibility HET-6 protein [Rhypophila decipiens]